ncbi:MAG TPA: MASE1 domain-containing protein [Vicinamibacteria bacterium]|nr:MASE1 domain-containing protein [Vicinamibacteria bacterium]
MQDGRSSRSSLVGSAWLFLAVAATYYLGARIGFVLRFWPATTSVVWPPNALLTAIFLLVSPRRWWLCLLAALPAHVAVEALAGFPVTLVGALFLTNSFEALLAAGLVRRWGGDPVAFDSLRRVMVFVAGAVVLAPLASTFPDAAAVHFLRGEPFGLVCLRRFLSNSLSQLTLVPSAILVVSRGADWLRESKRHDRIEAVLFTLALAAVSVVAFRGAQGSASLPGSPYTVLPFLTPLLIYAAVRFGPGGASLSLLATAVLAIGIAMSGWTPMTELPAEERVMAFQVFLLVVGVPLLVSSALIEERRAAEEKLRERLRFEELLSPLAGAFVNVSSHQMVREFETWLERIARFFGLDRVTLWQISDADRALVRMASWSGSRASAPLSRIEGREAEWRIGRLRRQEPITWPDPEEPPSADAAEEAIRGPASLASQLLVPLVSGDHVLGGLALVASSAGRTWSDDAVRQGRLVADVLGAALARKLAEDALRDNEAMKSAVLASMTSRVAVLDRDGRIIGVNESWTRFAGESPSTDDAAVGVGASYVDACRTAAGKGDEGARDLQAGVVGVLDGTRPTYSQEYRSSCAPERWFHVTVVPLERPDGGAVVSHADVTERRQAEADAEESRQELAHFLRVSTIGEMTTSIAHELNQPLAAILANAQTARRILSGPTSAESRREVQDIVEDIIEDDRRAGEVIRGVRDLLRKGEGARQDLDVSALVRGVIKLLGNDLMLRGVTIRPELAEEALVTHGDPVQLQQVLLNLLVNALEAVADAEGERRVAIRTERAPGGMARVSVEDSGPGLPPPVRSQIFKPFFTTKPRGMGMGLAIARSILEAHGGAIAIDDRPRGACFAFTVPLVEVLPAEETRR